jgi:hypothetical protein
MSYNYKKLLPKIQATIEKYGVELDVYRDTYESEVGVQTYKDTSLVATIKGVLDNSKSSNSNVQQEQQFHQYSINGTLYYAYFQDPTYTIEPGDYVIINNIKYILDMPVDILEVGLLYQVSVRGVKYEC